MNASARICRITKLPFEVGEGELHLLHRIPELSPALRGEALPLPTVHPYEHLRRMYVYGALRKLYRAKSAISGTPQLTRYNPALGTKICTYDEFYSDAIDNTKLGRPYDFKRPFFDQWVELLYSVILPPLNRRNCEDSDYVNGAEELHRCYLCFWGQRSEDCMYCLFIIGCTDCVDCAYCKECQLCYGSRDLTRCYEVQDSADCTDSRNLFGCYDCRSCSNCYGCSGLDHASYQIFNQPSSQDQYRAFIESKQLESFSGRAAAQQECRKYVESTGRVANTFVDCSNCTGGYLSRCENAVECYNGISTRNSGFLISSDGAEYCYRGLAAKAEFNYSAHCIGANVNVYSYGIFGGEANIYSAFMLQNCSSCFGSIALRAKSYCVLNREYTKEEYLELTARIISHMKSTGEWGEWFPPGKAPHSYQESSIHESLAPIPLSVARERGYRVVDEEKVDASAAKISGNDLPDRITAKDASTYQSQSVSCVKTGQVFNFQKRELEYYLRNGIPLPRIHWNERLQAFVNNHSLFPAI